MKSMGIKAKRIIRRLFEAVMRAKLRYCYWRWRAKEPWEGDLGSRAGRAGMTPCSEKGEQETWHGSHGGGLGALRLPEPVGREGGDGGWGLHRAAVGSGESERGGAWQRRREEEGTEPSPAEGVGECGEGARRMSLREGHFMCPREQGCGPDRPDTGFRFQLSAPLLPSLARGVESWLYRHVQYRRMSLSSHPFVCWPNVLLFLELGL